jgi:hypothetical protein
MSLRVARECDGAASPHRAARAWLRDLPDVSGGFSGWKVLLNLDGIEHMDGGAGNHRDGGSPAEESPRVLAVPARAADSDLLS